MLQKLKVTSSIALVALFLLEWTQSPRLVEKRGRDLGRWTIFPRLDGARNGRVHLSKQGKTIFHLLGD